MSGFAFDDDGNTPSSYDPSEFDDTPEGDGPSSDDDVAAATMIQNLTAPAPAPGDTAHLSEEEVDLNYMNEVDRRLDVANCYREILTVPLFDDADENTSVVEREIRHFVMQRLQVLMGARNDGQGPILTAKPQFNDGEVTSLKFLMAAQPLRALAGLSEREIQALKTLAAVALKQKGLVPGPAVPPAAPAQKIQPRAAIARRKPTPVPAAAPVAPKSAPPPPPPAPPAPAQQPAQQPARTTRAGSRVAPGRRSARAQPPASPTQAPAMEIPALRDDGTETKLQRIQRPAGMVPFPTDTRSMEGALAGAAAAASVSHAANILNPNKVARPA